MALFSVRLVLLILLCAFGGATLRAEVTPEMAATATRLMEQARAGNRAYDIVRSLTTEVGPRLAGTDAEARARDWAVAALAKLGFANVRVEPFEVPLWLRGVERAAITRPFPQPLTVTALGGSVTTGPDGVEGEVVLFESLAALEAAAPGSLEGKIAFIDEVMARSRDGSGYSRAVGKRRQAAYSAERLGALAVLIRSVGTSLHRFAHTGQMRRALDKGPAGVPAAALAVTDAEQLRRVLAFGEPVRVSLTLTPELRPAASSGNVVAEITGREVPDEVVLIGAHLDSWDLGTGAIDDGAGVGIVIAAARLLLEHLEQPPRRTIRIVLFGAEEVGLIGARAYTDRYQQALGTHIIATESDFGAGDIWRFDSGVAERALPLMAEFAQVLSVLDIAPGDNTARGGPDIKYLREAGVPVAGLYQDGTDYFNYHHTADDTLDKIASGALDQNVAAYAAFMFLAAETTAYFR